jgi:hypothetical protein
MQNVGNCSCAKRPSSSYAGFFGVAIPAKREAWGHCSERSEGRGPMTYGYGRLTRIIICFVEVAVRLGTGQRREVREMCIEYNDECYDR